MLALAALPMWHEALAITAGQRAFDAGAGRRYELVAGDAGKGPSLRIAMRDGGAQLAEWPLPGPGRLLAVDGGGHIACVLGFRPAMAKKARAGEPRPEDWVLWKLDLATGQVTGGSPMGLEPLAVALHDGGGGMRLFVAAKDRVATWTLQPLASSWFYVSPGINRDVAVSGAPAAAEAVVAILREGQLAIIDPQRRPREDGRVKMSNDDVTSTIAIPDRGVSVGVNGEGTLAAVLHEDRTHMTWADLRDGTIVETEPLPAALDQVSRVTRVAQERITPDPEPPPGEPDAGAIAAAPQPAPAAPEAGPPAVEPADGPPPVKPEPEPAPETERGLKTEPAAQGGQEEAAPEPASPPAAPPVAAVQASATATLSGKVTGSVPGGVEVLLFGPSNIIKLHARVPVGEDGAFEAPLPPPGSYRVVVRPKDSVQLFTRPEMRTIVVKRDEGGLAGIDFEVRGAFE